MKYVLMVMMLMGTMMAQKAAAPKATLTPHSVALTWTQGTVTCSVAPCAVITGNNVYRGTVSGGPYTLITGACSGPCVAYTDTTVAQGATYYYTVTALCSACSPTTESPKSNEAKAGPIPQDNIPNAPVLNTPVVSELFYPWTPEYLVGF